MRICFDIDGVIAKLKLNGESYGDVLPVEGAMEILNRLRADGHYIILHTARHMKTTGANLGLVVAKEGLTLLEWLNFHQIPFDEIYFGKPWADVYIDDNGHRFESWENVWRFLSRLEE